MGLDTLHIHRNWHNKYPIHFHLWQFWTTNHISFSLYCSVETSIFCAFIRYVCCRCVEQPSENNGKWKQFREFYYFMMSFFLCVWIVYWCVCMSIRILNPKYKHMGSLCLWNMHTSMYLLTLGHFRYLFHQFFFHNFEQAEKKLYFFRVNCYKHLTAWLQSL